jgi:CRP-like cAMP-binding protein
MNPVEKYLSEYFPLSKEVMKDVIAKFRREELSKGDYFLKVGRPALKLGFIETGLIRIYATSEEKEVTQWISTPGYFVTELSSFIFQQPSRLNLQALEDCIIWSISKEDHQQLCKDHAEWNEVDKKFIAKCFVILEDRIFSHLYMTAEERFKQLMDFNPELFNKVPLQYLASMLGMTPETLSRMRKKTSTDSV